MRGFLYIFSAMIVVSLGFWAYQENYRTQASIKEVRQLHASIGAAHARLNMLNAEWAYLNRPDRLRDLADLNFERLQLIPLRPESFGNVGAVAYPLPDLGPITTPVEVSAQLNPNEEPL